MLAIFFGMLVVVGFEDIKQVGYAGSYSGIYALVKKLDARNSLVLKKERGSIFDSGVVSVLDLGSEAYGLLCLASCFVKKWHEM